MQGPVELGPGGREVPLCVGDTAQGSISQAYAIDRSGICGASKALQRQRLRHSKVSCQAPRLGEINGEPTMKLGESKICKL